jgi:hypothetical protein
LNNLGTVCRRFFQYDQILAASLPIIDGFGTNRLKAALNRRIETVSGKDRQGMMTLQVRPAGRTIRRLRPTLTPGRFSQPAARFSIFAQVSRSPIVRLNTGVPGCESGSTQKYPMRSN